MTKKQMVYLIVGLIIVIFLLLYVSYNKQLEFDTLKIESDVLESDYNTLVNTSTNLSNDYDQLIDAYHSLDTNYSVLTAEYNSLLVNYSELEKIYIPSTLVKNNTIYFKFKDLDENIITWNISFESSYKNYILNKLRPITYKYIDVNDETWAVLDINPFVKSDLFEEIVIDLIDGKTDKEFVYEVINLKNQMISYGLFWENNCRWPIETLLEGVGDCEDASVLIASILEAGNKIGNYGMTISFMACDIHNITDPTYPNHVIVDVEFKDGASYLIEPTAKTFYTYDRVVGWKI